jgi:hypothetical protein
MYVAVLFSFYRGFDDAFWNFSGGVLSVAAPFSCSRSESVRV